MAGVSVTFATNGEATVTVKGTCLEDASHEVEKILNEGIFSEVKLIAQMFRDAPAAGLDTVKQVFPDAQVISESEPPKPAPAKPALRVNAPPLRV